MRTLHVKTVEIIPKTPLSFVHSHPKNNQLSLNLSMFMIDKKNICRFKLFTICQLVTTKFLTVFSTVVCRTGVSLNPSISASSP